MPQKQVKTRVPRPVRRMGTEVHEDTRTARQRQRGQAERAALDAELDDFLHEVDEVLDDSEEMRDAQAFIDSFKQRGGQ